MSNEPCPWPLSLESPEERQRRFFGILQPRESVRVSPLGASGGRRNTSYRVIRLQPQHRELSSHWT